MSFSPDLRTPRTEKMNSKTSHPKMFVNAGNTAGTAAMRDRERTEEPTNGISHELFKERTRANLGPLNEQILTFIQPLN